MTPSLDLAMASTGSKLTSAGQMLAEYPGITEGWCSEPPGLEHERDVSEENFSRVVLEMNILNDCRWL